MSSFAGRDLISMQDLSRDEVTCILDRAQVMKAAPQEQRHLLAGYILAACFFEPSTRTRLSFEAAMLRLGGSCIGFAGAGASSTVKGESLYDTMKITGQYADILAVRHSVEGAACLAAEATDKPVINAGDGAHQHPTQALLDLFSIRECQGGLDGRSVAIVGDLKFGRAAHSLAQACALFDIRLYFVSPEALEMPKIICDDLRRRGVRFSFHHDISQVIGKVDIVYMTRPQKERFQAMETHPTSWIITPELLRQGKATLKVLHPLPRNEEIPREIDTMPQAYYFQQAENGVYIRQALLAMMLGK